MKCEIKWIDKDGRQTPDENEAVAMAHHHESIWSHPGGHIDNRIVGYKPDVIERSFPICAAHLAVAQQTRRLHLERGGGWSFTPLTLTPEDIRTMAENGGAVRLQGQG